MLYQPFKCSAVKFLVTCITVFGIFSNIAPTHAQIAPQETTASSSITQRSVVLNDTNLTNVTVSEKNNTYTGSFSLQQKLGLQNNLVFGIVVRNTKNNVIDIQKIGQEAVLYEGQIKQYPFSYTLPSHISGEARISLEVSTQEGLIVGTYKLATKKGTGTSTSFTCEQSLVSSQNKNTSSCVVGPKDVALTVSIYRGSFFGAPGTTTQLTKNSKEVFLLSSLMNNQLPGRYFITIVDPLQKQTSVIPYIVQGTFAQIQNIAVAKDKENTIYATGYVVNNIKGAQAKVTFATPEGIVCAEKIVPLSGRTFSTNLPSSCTDGTVTIRITDTNNTIYDSKTFQFSTEKKSLVSNTTQSEPQQKEKTYSILSILGYSTLFLALLLLLLIFLKNKKFTTVISVLLLSIAITSISRTNALTIETNTLKDGNPYQYCTLIMSSDKAEYVQGDTLDMFFDFSAQQSDYFLDDDEVVCRAGYKPDIDYLDVNYPLYDSTLLFDNDSPLGETISKNVSELTGTTTVTTTLTKTFQVGGVSTSSNALPIGDHTIPFQVMILSPNIGCTTSPGNCATMSTSTANFTVTVVAPPSADCTGTPWGTVASGYSNTAYQSSSVSLGSSCVSETRTCDNGTLSGSYTNTSCAVDPTVDPDPATSCSSEVITWGSSCSAPIATSTVGTSLVLTDTTGELTGTATFECVERTTGGMIEGGELIRVWLESSSTCEPSIPAITLSPASTSCLITVGNNSCTVPITWNSYNIPEGEGAVSIVGDTETYATSALSGTRSFTIPRGGDSLSALHDSVDVTFPTPLALGSTCSSNTSWSILSQKCEGPEVVSISVTGRHYYNSPEALYFSCAHATDFRITKDGSPFFPYDTKTPFAGTPTELTVPLTLSGSYGVICIAGDVESDPVVEEYDASAPVVSSMSFDMYPGTTVRGGRVVTSWRIATPPVSPACQLIANAVCTNNECTDEQNEAALVLQETIDSDNTDVGDRTIVEAVATIHPSQEGLPTPYAYGKKTFTIDATTDFTLDCGGEKVLRKRVWITNNTVD